MYFEYVFIFFYPLSLNEFLQIDVPEIKPFVISVWCGVGKPKNLEEFLSPLIEDLNDLLKNGLSVNNHLIKISRICFVCDAPARCFLKGK